MSQRARTTRGKFVQKHTEYDKTRFVTIEAQHLREGMMIETPAHGIRRVTAVHKRHPKVVEIHYDKGNTLHRKWEEPLVVDAEDLPTALMLAGEDIPRKKMGSNDWVPPKV